LQLVPQFQRRIYVVDRQDFGQNVLQEAVRKTEPVAEQVDSEGRIHVGILSHVVADKQVVGQYLGGLHGQLKLLPWRRSLSAEKVEVVRDDDPREVGQRKEAV